MNRFFAGIDIGSTTIKAVVTSAADGEIIWKDYRRHETRQQETLLDFLGRMEAESGISPDNCRAFMTGSSGQMFADIVGAKFVQEVLAASLAVERRNPDASAIVEIGGQDAKIVVLRRENGAVKKFPSMNDKCAGGTGAVIDKIGKKLGIPLDDISGLHYDGIRLHPVAGKCGVFAETDINGLQKRGVPARELMASLFEAFVMQNLQVLARGHTLMPHVILLGGPNAFIPGMREAWRRNIILMWRERGVEIPENARTEDLIYAPPLAEYYGAIGAIEYGREEELEVGRYHGAEKLREHRDRHASERGGQGVPALVGSERQVEEFLKAYAPPKFTPPLYRPGDVARGFIGIDGGSTSTKAVLLSKEGEVLARAYQLSKGNPIQDTIEILEKLRGQIESQGAVIEVLGAATTGYAKDTLRDVIRADVALVETVAHTKSALHYYGVPDAIVDVGGQDIKLMILKDGRVKDFKLNTQCSAGNGYFLQAIAEGFGYRVEQFAETAFTAREMPVFPYGCAVFLQSDIESFQGQGWQPNEILAGLAAVLPKNVWLYIAKIPNLAELGTRFILQGGTQNNLAAVKAQVDFIHERFRGTGKTPEITVHKHAGEAGAIGAAFEAMTLIEAGRETTFIGLDAVRKIEYKTTVGEETRCRFCKNDCLRTFIDISVDGENRRLIIATCEKGGVDDVGAMKDIHATLSAAMKANPNLLEYANRQVWKISAPGESPADSARRALPKGVAAKREKFRVGFPRVLSLYAYAPLFSRYFESLGIQPDNIVFSDYTNEEMFRAGSKRGSIDPCYPSKLALAHVHNLLFEKHKRRALDCIFFPMTDVLRSPLVIRAQNACPTSALTPEVVRAAFIKETDLFRDNGVLYLNPLLDLSKPQLLARQMYAEFEPVLGLSKKENLRAVEAGYENLDKYEAELQRKARETLERLEKENRLGIVLLGRPYHHDPGIHLGIPEELQKRGYPVFSQSTLPLDEDILERLFGDEVREGIIETPMDIGDVWKHTFSANSAFKVWAAKFTARHPNLIAVELSNFKCGHDAPIYSTIERIIETSGTPYFAFKDIDENRPMGSIRLRVETIDYFLQQYRQVLN
ncbi:MAG: acyl-CoA dehydratase activase-related protein [Acidobacteria bacterium]|nr:acyl-CoA dehydratase activase-related protein [Acidobacteriota bacterium]